PANRPRDILAEIIEKRGLGPWLMGVDWCHINDYVDAKDPQGNKLPFRVRSNSGMMGVVPIWKLEELLSRDDVKAHRMKNKRAAQATPDSAASRDSAGPQSSDENPKHREDFNSLLHAAARKPAREG